MTQLLQYQNQNMNIRTTLHKLENLTINHQTVGTTNNNIYVKMAVIHYFSHSDVRSDLLNGEEHTE